MIANGNVVKDDDVIFFLTTMRGTQVGTQVNLYQQLQLVKITSGRSPGSVNYFAQLTLPRCRILLNAKCQIGAAYCARR